MMYYYSTAGSRSVSAAYACIAEHAGVKTVLTVLLMVAAIATTLIFHLSIQNDLKTEEETRVEINPQEETKIDIPNTLVEPSQTLSDEVDSTLNVSVSAQTTVVVDTSVTASLLHQTTIETSSFHIERDMLPEGQETSPGVATGVPSQPHHQPSPPVVAAVAENETPNPNLKTEFKVANWVTMISSGAIVSVVSGLVGNEKATLIHKILFKAFSILNYVSLVLGVGLLVLILTRPTIPGFVKVTKFVMWIAIGSITYALGCATCLLLPKLVEIVPVLVVPFVIVCLIATLSFGRRN